MEHMLLCVNARCRFLLDLSQANQSIARSPLVIGGCPECGHAWSSSCPACGKTLSVSWTGHHAHCAGCGEALRPQKSTTQSRAAAA
jgi:hypothetical protein